MQVILCLASGESVTPELQSLRCMGCSACTTPCCVYLAEEQSAGECLQKADMCSATATILEAALASASQQICVTAAAYSIMRSPIVPSSQPHCKLPGCKHLPDLLLRHVLHALSCTQHSLTLQPRQVTCLQLGTEQAHLQELDTGHCPLTAHKAHRESMSRISANLLVPYYLHCICPDDNNSQLCALADS